MDVLPDHRQPATVLTQLRGVLEFCDGRAFDANGGFFSAFDADGEVLDGPHRLLPDSARMVLLWAAAVRHFPGQPAYRAHLRHALDFLRRAHRNPVSGGYAWQLRCDGPRSTVVDAALRCDGHALVLLAFTQAAQAGETDAWGWVDETFALMERHFWQPHQGRYGGVAPDRGVQLLATEACLAAFGATGQGLYLDRAALLARHVAELGAGPLLAAEGAAPGGHAAGLDLAWARVLVLLERQRPRPGLLPLAEALFERAFDRAWDPLHGGLFSGLGPHRGDDGDRKPAAVQCEGLAAAAMLALRTADPAYWHWYDRLWQHCVQHVISPRHGAWFQTLGRGHRPVDSLPAFGAESAHHAVAACSEILRTLRS